MFEEKIVKANEEIKKVADYLKEHEEAFQSMNLKLYDAFYYFGSDEMKEEFPLVYENNNGREYDDFYWFCEDNYDMFKEDLQESFGIDFSEMQNYIGRTSSFYLHDGNNICFDKYGNVDYNTSIDWFISNLYGLEYINLENGFIYLNEDDYEEEERELIENDLDYIINEFYNDVVNYCKDIVTVYEIIKNFKDNQVKYFKEYLECQEEILQEEKEGEERIEKENKDNCVSIKEKYNISDDDMETLRKCIADYE